VLVLALRSFRYGLFSLVPNVLPILAAFGIWALVVGEVGLSLSVVAALTLGIVVDDTIHLLHAYLNALRRGGLSSHQAAVRSLQQVGPALIITSLVLIAGFLTLSFSHFGVNRWMGQLAALTIALALVFDLVVLPALLLVLDGKWKPRASASTENAALPSQS
ncbi:MAG: efflux RND transporter permease subunit, partial [Verrucomicrobiota bacterium]